MLPTLTICVCVCVFALQAEAAASIVRLESELKQHLQKLVVKHDTFQQQIAAGEKATLSITYCE